ARSCMSRLDSILGAANWRTEFERWPNGAVVCKLSLRIDGEWIQKSELGAEAQTDDAADKIKSGASDSFKRVCMAWGIGRYLYRLPGVGVDLARERGIKTTPELPPWARPSEAKATAPKAPPAPKPMGQRKPGMNGSHNGTPPLAVLEPPPEAAGGDYSPDDC